jgi:hypothetical protein
MGKKPPASASAPMEGLLRQGICSDAARQWLRQKPEAGAEWIRHQEMIARYPEHPLRTLDALHLTVAADLAVSMIATADGVMADAALSMGWQVERF